MSDAPRLIRRKEAAQVLGVSESQLLKFERQGILRPVRIPALRAVRYVASDVDAVAVGWIEASLGPDAVLPAGVA
jgi:predicted DNA-binding transcriptional regulator AlpA